MRALGFEVKKVDVLKILKDYDREGNGKITFEDFNEVGKFAFGFRHRSSRRLSGESLTRSCRRLLRSDRSHPGARPQGGDHEGLQAVRRRRVGKDQPEEPETGGTGTRGEHQRRGAAQHDRRVRRGRRR